MNPSKIAVALAASLFLVTASAQDKGGPSDPQIAGIVVAADQIDIDAGKLAKSRTKNKQVSEFAQLMITDHTAVNKQAGASLPASMSIWSADRKSTRLNSSHANISYAVFCL